MIISYNTNTICTRSYDNFTVIYDLMNKQILTLEAVASDIWNYLISKKVASIDDLVTHITGIYDCSKEEIVEDIKDFVKSLYDSNIVSFDGKYAHNTNVYQNEVLSLKDTQNDLEGNIIDELETENQLYSATIEMTYACNEKCIHCYAHYPEADITPSHLTLNEYKLFIDQLYSQKCMHIAFTGGDPFMNPYFPSVFRYAREKGFVCDIFTNAQYLFHHPEVLKEIIDLYPRAFYISLYGSTSQTHDLITNVPGSFDNTICIVKKLREMNLSVVLNIMVMSPNYTDFPNIIRLAKHLNCEFRVSMSLISRNDNNDSPMEYFLNDKEKVMNVLKTTDENLYSFDQPIKSNNKKNSPYICGAGVTSLCLSPDGTVNPCVSLKRPFGFFPKQSINEIWSSTPRKNLISNLTWSNTSNCSNCEMLTDCPHCPAISQAETGDIFSCNTCDHLIAESIHSLKKTDNRLL